MPNQKRHHSCHGDGPQPDFRTKNPSLGRGFVYRNQEDLVVKGFSTPDNLKDLIGNSSLPCLVIGKGELVF